MYAKLRLYHLSIQKYITLTELAQLSLSPQIGKTGDTIATLLFKSAAVAVLRTERCFIDPVRSCFKTVMVQIRAENSEKKRPASKIKAARTEKVSGEPEEAWAVEFSKTTRAVM